MYVKSFTALFCFTVCVYVCERESVSATTMSTMTAAAAGSSFAFTRISPTFSLVPFLAAVALRTIF